MKRLLSLTVIVLFTVHATYAQRLPLELPTSGFIAAYDLAVGYDQTTMLVFPATIKPGDKGAGDQDLIVRRQPGTANMLAIKAGRKNFAPTSLHVITSDGKLYVFCVRFAPKPLFLAYDFTHIDTNNLTVTGHSASKVIFPGGTPNDQDIASTATATRNARPQFSLRSHKYRMSLALQNIVHHGPLLYFHLTIRNKSTLPYPPDFLRICIRDQRRLKRTSFQETEMVPVYQEPLRPVAAHATLDYIFAVPAFTIPDMKKFIVEIFEHNGGRNLSLSIPNRLLLKAKAL